MKYYIKYLPLLALILTACTKKESTTKNLDPNDSSTILKTPDRQKRVFNKQESDTMTITSKTAVFYVPDNKRIEERKKAVGEEAFMMGADDYLFYLNNSQEFLEKQKLTVNITEHEKILQFILTDKSKVYVKLDTLQELWGIFLFDPRTAPKLIDMVTIEEEYQKYYK